MRHRRRRPGRHDARLPAGPRRHRRRGAGEARRFPARFPRRHHPSLDARDHVRARHSRRFPQAPASRGARARGPDRRRARRPRRFLASADALPLHRLDAAMGLSRFPRRAGAPLSGLSSQDARARHRPHHGAWPCAWSSCRDAGGSARDQGRSRRRRRRPPLRCADARRAEGRGFRRADGRALVPPLQAPERRRADARPHPGRRGVRHARPRRLLAMRLCHPERRLRPAAQQGARRVSRGDRRAQPRLRRSRAGDRLLGRRQAADRHGRPPQALEPAGAALHRRCGARHVAGRRRRHQSRHPGCGRRGQSSLGAAEQGPRAGRSAWQACRRGANGRPR